MKKDVVVIGGGPSAVIAALTSRSVYPEKSVCLVKSIGDGVVPCAIPYMMSTMDDPEQNALGDMNLDMAGVEVCVDTAMSFDEKKHEVTFKSGDVFEYEKLVLATGTDSVLPPIKGIEKSGVYRIIKSLDDMCDLRDAVEAAKNVVLIGGGFIGVEFADELTKCGLDSLHLVEVRERLTEAAFDDAFCDTIGKILKDKDVNVHTGIMVESINGDDHVQSVTLSNGEVLEADLVLLGAGARPANDVARESGLALDELGSIVVDDYMRTDAKDVFAIGDCAQKRDFFTRKPVPIWLASTATAEARIAATNLYKIRVVRQIAGTISAFSTKVGDTCFASAGMTCRALDEEGFRYVDATVTVPDRHPGSLPGSTPLTLKLIFADRSGILLGGQSSGGPSVGELINVVALAIQKKATVRELEMMQVATHPLLTPAPTVHPIANASHKALTKIRKAYK